MSLTDDDLCKIFTIISLKYNGGLNIDFDVIKLALDALIITEIDNNGKFDTSSYFSDYMIRQYRDNSCITNGFISENNSNTNSAAIIFFVIEYIAQKNNIKTYEINYPSEIVKLIEELYPGKINTYTINNSYVIRC